MTDQTFGSRLQETGGRSSGFDYLRIVLSVAIASWHAVLITSGPSLAGDFWSGPWRPLTFSLVPIFFALSGFLVSGSLFRNDLLSFLALRVLRIAPALMCEVVISALIIGPSLTALPWRAYFGDPHLYTYFGNIAGDIQYTLPGLFLANPYAGNVNAQLWTIPSELHCYLILAVLALFGVVRRPRALLLLVLGAVALLSARDALTQFTPVHAGPTGLLCILCFLCGVALYVWRDVIPCSTGLLASALALSWVCMSHVQTMYLAAPAVAYATIWTGLQNPPKPKLLRHADYSYGLYLYHFPVEQALYQLGARSWFINFPLSLLLSWGAAALSWTWVESRILDHRKPVLTALSRLTAPLHAGAVAVKGWRPSARAQGVVSGLLLAAASAVFISAIELALAV